MTMRGVQKQNAVTLTRALRGAHEEILPLVKER
jgi:GTP cyclohydrolase I